MYVDSHGRRPERSTPRRYQRRNRWTANVWRLFRARNNGHHFAIRTLLDWYQSDTDVEAHLPELAAYLGHTHARDSYWYLSAVPELLHLATLRWERTEKGAA
jgi:hypothetical protein